MGDADRPTDHLQPPAKKRGSDRQLTKDDASDSEGGEVADPGTFARAPDAVLKTRKIIKARRGGGGDGSGDGGGANPFAGVSLTAPAVPPPAAAATAAANPFLAVKKDEDEAKGGEAPPLAAEPAAAEAPRSPVASPGHPAADDDAPSAKPADDKPVVTAAAPSFGGGGGFSAAGGCFGGLAAAATSGFGGGGGFGGAASGGFGALAAKAGAGGGTGFWFGGKSDADAPPADDDATKPAPAFGFPAADGGGFPSPAAVFGGGSGGGGGGATTTPLPPTADQPHLTGEEGEDTVFAGDGALFEYKPPSAPGKAGAWRERGKGELRVNVGGGASGGARMVMRSRGHLRLLLNAALWPAMKVTRMEGGKGATFVVVNAAAGGGDDAKKDTPADGDAPPPKLTTYAFRVGALAKLDEFVAAVDENKGSE